MSVDQSQTSVAYAKVTWKHCERGNGIKILPKNLTNFSMFKWVAAVIYSHTCCINFIPFFLQRVGTIWNSWPSTTNAFIRTYSKPLTINWNSNSVILPHNERKPVSRRSSKVCSVRMLIAMWNRCPYHAMTVYCAHTISVRLGIKTVPKVNRRNVWNSINHKWSPNSSTMCRCVLDSNIQWKWIKLETFTICAAMINRGNWMRPAHGVL